jgi:translation initiation factor 2-alpha kinase 4
MVLKAKHKIDLNIYAIKIIAINNLNVQSVSAEVRTMLKIRSKHIVEYKTCWTDTSLGSASAFFSQSEQSSLLTSTFKKSTPNQSNINNDSTCNKNPKNKLYYNEVLSDEIQQSKHLHSKPITDFIDDSNYQLNAQKSKMSRNTLLTQDYIDNLYFFIQMEYCNGLPLDKYIKSHSSIPHKTIFTFTQQILKSLNKIHSSGIIHRDIKPANIFVNNSCDIKIGDFGLATNIHSCINKEELVGTFLYLSPEQLSHKHYDERVDIFASGLVLYEMCACFETLMERRESIIALKNGKGVVKKVKESYPCETELILLMTKGDYKERPSASEIMKSKEFQMWKDEIERSNN